MEWGSHVGEELCQCKQFATLHNVWIEDVCGYNMWCMVLAGLQLLDQGHVTTTLGILVSRKMGVISPSFFQSSKPFTEQPRGWSVYMTLSRL